MNSTTPRRGTTPKETHIKAHIWTIVSIIAALVLTLIETLWKPFLIVCSAWAAYNLFIGNGLNRETFDLNFWRALGGVWLASIVGGYAVWIVQRMRK